MANGPVDCPSQGLLGLELDAVAPPGPPQRQTPAKVPKLAIPMPVVLGAPPTTSEVEPSAEALVQVQLDPASHAWWASVLVVGPGGELLDQQEETGQIALRAQTDPEVPDPQVLPGGYDLLGLAVDRGLALLEGMTLPEGCQVVLEASTHANATLSGRLRDWIRAGSFEPDAGARFPYAHEAWGRVAQQLWPAEGRPLAKVRWVI